MIQSIRILFVLYCILTYFLFSGILYITTPLLLFWSDYIVALDHPFVYYLIYPGFIQGFLQGLIIGLPYPGYFYILGYYFPWFIFLSFHTTSLIVYHVTICKIKHIYCQVYKLYAYAHRYNMLIPNRRTYYEPHQTWSFWKIDSPLFIN